MKIDSKKNFYSSIAQQIWSFAEMGYQEEKSSNLLKKILSDQEFNIKSGVANIPTAFTASYGSGLPIIAILGEYDALPGLSQKRVPYKISAGGKAGHACGHHLFGTASAAAGPEFGCQTWIFLGALMSPCCVVSGFRHFLILLFD